MNFYVLDLNSMMEQILIDQSLKILLKDFIEKLILDLNTVFAH